MRGLAVEREITCGVVKLGLFIPQLYYLYSVTYPTVDLPRAPLTTAEDLIRGRKVPFTIPISRNMLSLLKTVFDAGERSAWLRRVIAAALVEEANRQKIKDFILDVD